MITNHWQKYRLFFLIGTIFLAGFISYLNVYHNQFLWDDEFNIQKNTFIRSFSNLPNIFTTSSGAGAGRIDNFWRPMQLVAYSIIYSLFGLSKWAFHLLNILLHISNVILIFFVIKKIFKEDSIAFLTSMLWVVHPIHTEAVTYMSATADPLSVFFALGSFLLYLVFKEKKKIIYLASSCVLFILGLFSKESIIILPGLFLAYEFILANKKFDWKKYRFTIPFLIIALSYFFIRLTILNFGGTLNFYGAANPYTQHISYRIFTFLAALLKYYSFILLPINLHMERQFPVFTSLFNTNVLISIFILGIFCLLSYKSIKQKKPYLAFGFLWFFIAFIPMSGIIPVNAIILEHWLYLPSIGFFLIAAAFVNMAWRKYKEYHDFIVIGLALIIIISIGLTLNRNIDWKNPITFYENILQYNPGAARVHNNLAMAYANKGEIGLAEKHYLMAIQISDIYPQTHYNLARLYLKTNKTNLAISHLRRSIEINPNFFFSYRLLGDIYKTMGKNKQAKQYYKKAQGIKHY